MSTLIKLQNWFVSQCDGDWEHCAGISIRTLDNPGWAIDIELDGTVAYNLQVDPVRLDRSEDDWMRVSIHGTILRLCCGPSNLEEALDYALRLVTGGEEGLGAESSE